MYIRKSTRREFVIRSVRMLAMIAGLFMFLRFRTVLNFHGVVNSVFVIMVVAGLSAAFAYAGKIANFLIWEDCEISNRSMFRRFFISLIIGFICFGIHYLMTYPQRDGFYERSHYPESILTITAIIIGLFVTFSVFAGWYLVLYFAALAKHLKTKKETPCETNE